MRFTKLVLVLAAVFVVAGPAMAAITGTDHDFSSKGWNPRGEFCVPCHAPHNAINADEGPIWDHAVTTQTFTRHGATVTLGESSKLCMSCHDGLTAVDAFNGNTGSEYISGGAKIGTNLTDDHPVGVEYPTGGPYVAIGDVGSYLEDGKVECASCHRAHGHSTTDGKFLRKKITGSEICRVCHTF